MTAKTFTRLATQLSRCEPQIILCAASRCDGHSIFKPEAFLDAGLPHEVVEHLTRKYESDGSLKGSIFVEGRPVKELNGVYGLDLLRFLASALKIEYRRAMGRGFEAQNIRSALQAHFKTRPPESVS